MLNVPNNITEPKIDKRLLNPIERIAEIFFGLIMALTFTCSISIIGSDKAEIKDLLIGAISCNIAWGLVDAIMYLLTTITENGRGLNIINFVRKTDSIEKAHLFIADALPPSIASVMQQHDLENIRQKLVHMPELPKRKKLKFIDFKKALGIFLLVFLSTFPIVIPFIFIPDIQVALRSSNLIAVLMMFLSGWIWGKYAGRSRLLMGTLMSLLGIILVLITIALGG